MLRSFSLLVFAALSALLATVVDAYANPKLCQGVCTNAHDPSVVRRDDGTYFRFSTGNKISVHTAPDMTGPWTFIGAALPSGSTINLKGNQDLWAPDVAKVGNMYYLYYSVSSFGVQNSAIGLARSPTMDAGTWTDLGSAGITSDGSKPYNAIDSHLIQVGSNYYSTFGSSWNGIYQVQMSSNPITTVGSATHLATSSDREVIEGSFLYKHGNFYYLFFSMGSCCHYDKSRPAAGKEYRVMVCRSSLPTGAFTDKNGVACTNGGGSVVLASHGWVYGPGGQGVFDDPTYGPILYYHYVDTRIGYADGDKHFGWNQIDFSTGWPVV